MHPTPPHVSVLEAEDGSPRLPAEDSIRGSANAEVVEAAAVFSISGTFGRAFGETGLSPSVAVNSRVGFWFGKNRVPLTQRPIQCPV